MRPKLPQNKSLKRRPILKQEGPKSDKPPKIPVRHGPNAGRPQAGKKKGNGSPNKTWGGVGGYPGVPKKKVKRLVNGILKDELNDLQAQLAELRNDSQNDMQSARTDYRRGVGDLNYVYGETTDYLGSLADKTGAMYAGQATAAQQAQLALQAQLGSTYSGAQSGAESELARLGIQGGGDLSQLGADSQYAQATAAQSGANAQSSLGMAGANSMAGMQMLQGMNQGSFMQGIGQNLNARNDAFSEIRDNKMENVEAVRQAMQDAQGSRRDMFLQLLQQLQQTGWDQYVQQQQLQMQQQQNKLSMRAQRKALKKKK